MLTLTLTALLAATPAEVKAGPAICGVLRHYGPDDAVALSVQPAKTHVAVFSIVLVRDRETPDGQNTWFDETGRVFCLNGGKSGGDCIKKMPDEQVGPATSHRGTVKELRAQFGCAAK